MVGHLHTRRLIGFSGLGVLLVVVLLVGSAEASFGQSVKLIASDAEASDFFGNAVAVSGDIAVIGAWAENSAAPTAGAAYVFERDPAGWTEIKKLTASDAEAGDDFGRSVAVSGDVAVVSAYEEDTAAPDAGAVYVFLRHHGGPDNWGEVAKLTASDALEGDRFGGSVAVSGDTVLVGAGDARDEAGAAYVFRRQGGSWVQEAKLAASDAEAGDFFGHSVGISGDTIVVGAHREAAFGMDAGAIYVFDRDHGGPGAWGEVAKLTASDAEADDRLGDSVAIDDGTIVAGASAEDALGFNAGAAYVFDRDQGGSNAWGELAKLTASDAQPFARFGGSVSISGDRVAVGAWQHDTPAISAGAAYVFERDGNWGEVKRLTASDGQEEDRFGDSVAVDEDVILVGAFRHDERGDNAGAAYVFESGSEPPTPTPPLDLPGDANCDGAVNSIDAALVLQSNAGLLASLDCEDGADANSDGAVNSLDAALILQFVAGLLVALPP